MPISNASRCGPWSSPLNTCWPVRWHCVNGSTAAKLLRLAAAHAVIFRRADGLFDRAGTYIIKNEFADVAMPRPNQWLAVHDEHTFDRHTGQGICQQLRRIGAEGTDQLMRRRGRIRQRSKHVENSAHAERYRGPACIDFIAGWYAGAKRKVKFTASRQSITACSSSGSGMPRHSSTSALPDLLETERLPCLTTRAPAAAASRPAPVDRLRLSELSPPVPTESTVGGPSGMAGCNARSRIAVAKPRISSAVSPFARNPASRAPASATSFRSRRMQGHASDRKPRTRSRRCH